MPKQLIKPGTVPKPTRIKPRQKSNSTKKPREYKYTADNSKHVNFDLGSDVKEVKTKSSKMKLETKPDDDETIQ